MASTNQDNDHKDIHMVSNHPTNSIGKNVPERNPTISEDVIIHYGKDKYDPCQIMEGNGNFDQISNHGMPDICENERIFRVQSEVHHTNHIKPGAFPVRATNNDEQCTANRKQSDTSNDDFVARLPDVMESTDLINRSDQSTVEDFNSTYLVVPFRIILTKRSTKMMKQWIPYALVKGIKFGS
jgi:hypothetical protein